MPRRTRARFSLQSYAGNLPGQCDDTSPQASQRAWSQREHAKQHKCITVTLHHKQKRQPQLNAICLKKCTHATWG